MFRVNGEDVCVCVYVSVFCLYIIYKLIIPLFIVTIYYL